MNDNLIHMSRQPWPTALDTVLEHIRHIPASIENSRQEQQLCDVKIVYRDLVGWGQTFCHRCVLAAALPLLWHVLGDIDEEEVVIITEMTKEELNVFLKFIYTGEALGDNNGFTTLEENLRVLGFFQDDEFSFAENVGCDGKVPTKVTLYAADSEDPRAVKREDFKHAKGNDDREDHTICVSVDDQGNFSMQDNEFKETQISQYCNKKNSKKFMQINLGVTHQDDYEEETNLVEHIDDVMDEIKSYKKTSIVKDATFEVDTNILYLGIHPNSNAGTCFNKNSFVDSKLKLEELKTAYTTKKKNFRCIECGDRFSTEVKLTTHEADVHLALECRECGKVLKGNKLLIDHAALHNKSEKEDILSEKTENIPTALKRKRPIKQTDEKPTCDICFEKFVTKQALRFHEYKHSGIRPYVCKVCETSFRTPSTLRAHFDVQHSQSKHKCNECGLQSSTSGKLKIHMRTHSDEKPYQCSFCPSRFKQLQVLKIHEFTHTQESKYKCDKCHKYFPSKSRLIKHESQPVCKSRPRNQILKKLSQSKGIFSSDSNPIYKLTQSSVQEFEKDLKQTHNIVSNKYDNDESGLNKHDHIPGAEVLNTADIPVLVDELPVIGSDTGAFNFFESKN